MKTIIYAYLLSIFILTCSGCQTLSHKNQAVEELATKNRVDMLLNQFKTPNNQHILVAAHRGDWRNAPENSLLAIKRSISMGLDLVEIDIRISFDGKLVVFHDETLKRMTNHKGHVKDYTLNELTKIRLLDGLGHETKYTIPTLEQALKEAKNKILIKLDKAYPHFVQAFKIVKSLRMENQVIFVTDKPYQNTKTDHGDIIDQMLIMPAFNCDNPHIDEIISSYMQHHDPVAFEVGFSDVDCPSFKAVAKINQLNKTLFIDVLWASLVAGHDDHRAVEDPDGSWGWVVNQGGSVLCTDRPYDLINYLNNKGLREPM